MSKIKFKLQKFLLGKPKILRLIKVVLNFIKKIFLNKAEYLGIDRYKFNKELDLLEYINKNYDSTSDLFNIFISNKEKVLHKWIHYIPIYENFLSKYKDNNVNFLEIGVAEGGSLKLFRNFLGNKALIFGIDINEECKDLDGVDGEVRIGSQSDKKFLDSVFKEMGSIDIVLDDGSHRMKDIKTTFLHLFELLNEEGLYIIEDIHTSYWKRYGGGFNSKKNFFNFLRELIDDMHHWYHSNDQKYPSVSKYIQAIHIYDSIIVIEKKTVLEPVVVKIPDK